MKSYRYLAVAVIVLTFAAVVTRNVQLAARPAEPQNRGGAPPAPNQPEQRQAAQQQNAQQAPAGPATGLLNMMGVNTPDFESKSRRRSMPAASRLMRPRVEISSSSRMPVSVITQRPTNPWSL